jgi:hypothetical protein
MKWNEYSYRHRVGPASSSSSGDKRASRTSLGGRRGSLKGLEPMALPTDTFQRDAATRMNAKDTILQEAFDKLDVGGKGHLSHEECESLFTALNWESSTTEVAEMFKYLDLEHTGNLTLSEFKRWNEYSYKTRVLEDRTDDAVHAVGTSGAEQASIQRRASAEKRRNSNAKRASLKEGLNMMRRNSVCIAEDMAESAVVEDEEEQGDDSI